ncbi:M1 family metallopeptidase [Tsukamurella strandjordii]|uniref:M1 family metallopeptidase n=1 Tax=Tsukamurella TaxID=2060 RepID=UPI001C7CFAF5|nr:M1 family metallopeptidase [Tsukamurella sp. TY48]
MWMDRTKKAGLAAAGLITVIAATAGCSGARSDTPEPGARSAGDPLVSYLGNGGYDVASYEVGYDFRPGETTMASSVTIKATSLQALSEFSLDSAGQKITRVTVDGVQAGHRSESEKLIISPAAPVAKGTEFRVAIDFVADRQARPQSPAGDTVSNLKQWINFPDGFALFGQPDRAHLFFPMNDTLQDKARMTFKISAPADLQVAANGRRTERVEKDGRATSTFTTRDEISTQFVQATVGRYDEFTGSTATGMPLRSLIDTKVGARARPSVDLAGDQVAWMEKETGTAYPFEVFGLLGVDAASANGAALETATIPIYSAEGLTDPSRTPLVHELAHQWFGAAVTPKTWFDNWISEANASFYQYKYFDAVGTKKFQDSIANAYAQDAELRSDGGPAAKPKDVFAAIGQSYGGGIIMLYGLEKKVGAEKFKQIQKTFFEKYRYKSASTRDYIDTANAVSGEDLTGYIESWLYSPTAPPMP